MPDWLERVAGDAGRYGTRGSGGRGRGGGNRFGGAYFQQLAIMCQLMSFFPIIMVHLDGITLATNND